MFGNRFLDYLANFFIFAGLGILLFTFYPVAEQEIVYTLKHIAPSEQKVAETEKEIREAKDLEAKSLIPKSTVIFPVSFDFSLVIPKIGVNSEVFPNINSANESEYLPILKKGVAHAAGSSLPYEDGPIFIFAHSTDVFYNIAHYNAVFFLLHRLGRGDDIYIFYNNRKYSYKVTEKKIVTPADIPNEVKNAANNTLILQTCWPPGTTLQRLLVFSAKI
jgi:sortase A